jgi:hypothetical protein
MGSKDLGKKSWKSKAKKAYGHAQWATPTGAITNIIKILTKKKNTNVSKAGKEKRRARQDARWEKKGGRSEKQQAIVDARRAKIDAKDKKRWTKNPEARKRIQRKVDRMNKNRGTNYKGPAGLFED